MKRENSLNSLLIRMFVISLIICQSVAIQAAPGDLDITFGIGGKVTTQTGYDDIAYAAALQADGKIVVAGTRKVNYETALVARFNADGSLDQSFGIGGFVNDSAHGGHRTYFTAVAVQTDGKIVAAGYFYEFAGCPGYRTTVFRYNADGSRDTTFDGDGTLEIGFLSINGCPADSYASGLAVQSNGKIVVGGSSNTASGYHDFAAARLNTNGSLDTSFNLDGLATFPIGSGSNSAYSVAVQPSTGKIILAGYSYSSATSNNFALIRLHANGLYDWSFGNGGAVTTDISGNNDLANAVAFQADGKIVAGGLRTASTGADFALVRYNSNGTLDPTFDGNGKVGTVFSVYDDIIYGIGVQANGRIVAAGSGVLPGDSGFNFAVARYRTNAALDLTFSGDGKLTTDFVGGIYYDFGRAVVIQADGKIIVAGYAANSIADHHIALARYEP